MRSLILFAAILGLSWRAGAATPPALTPAQTTAVADAERRGRDIFDFDQAAWGSTDALTAALPDPGKAGVKGWIVEREPAGAIAIYYGLRDGKAYKIFVAHMRGRSVTASHILAAGEDNAMTPIEQRMAAARAIAVSRETLVKIGFQPCERAAVNSVVLQPASANEDVSVYLLTPQVANNRYPFGGHYRVDVTPDGLVKSSRPFSKSCIAMAPQPPQGGAPAAMVMTHLLDAQPTEIHVWLSLVSNLPVIVGTISSNEIWAVQHGAIRLVRAISETPPAS